MRHLLQVFLYELRRNIRRRGYLFATLGVPLIGIVLVFVLRLTGTSPADMTTDSMGEVMEAVDLSGVQGRGVVDQTGIITELGDQAEDFTIYPDEAMAQTALNNGDIELFFVLEPDYVETGDVRLVMPTLNLNLLGNGEIRRLIMENLSGDVEAQTMARLANPSNIQVSSRVMVNSTQGEDTAFLLVYVFAVMLMVSLFVTNGYLMQSVIEEKETRLIEILLTTLRPWQLLGGKILALGLLGLVQLAAWLGGSLLAIRFSGGDQMGQTVGILASLANIRIPTEIIPLLFVYFIFSYLLFATFYSMVGAISNSMREGPQYAVFFTIPAIVPLALTSLFASTPDGVIPVILSLFPITAPIAMAQRLVISSVPAWQIIVSLTLLLLSGIGMLWLVGRVFRVQTLLAGNPFKLRDLPALLRG